MKRLPIFMAALWLSGATMAQPFETPPPPAAPRPLRIEAPTEFTLANGLRVVVAERRNVPLVTAQLVLLSGAEVDPPQRSGLASLTANLLARGTKRLSAEAQAKAAEALGGTLSTAAEWQQSSISLTVTSPRLGAALSLLAEAAVLPAFAQGELARLRAETLDELKVDYSRPGTLAAQAANRMLFGDGAYGHAPTGTPTSLARITRADVLALHRDRYRPDNAVLVLAGDIDAAQAAELATRHLGAWRSPAGALPATPKAAGKPSAASLALIDMGESGQAAVVLALPLPAAGGTDQAVGEVSNAVLGGDYSSRLNQEIRIKRGLSYSAGSRLAARRQVSVLLASVQTKNESAAEVVALVQAQMDSLATTAVPPEELAARKATLIGKFSRRVETTAELASLITATLAAGQPSAGLTTRIAAIGAVDAAAVQAYASAHFAAGQRKVAVAGDAKAFAAALTVQPQDGQPAARVTKAAELEP